MSINRRQLFLDRFLAYNRSRYKDNPDALKRLNALKFEDMVFDGIGVDSTKPGETRRRAANFTALAQNMDGIDQRWTCTSLINKKIIPEEHYTVTTVYSSLADLIAVNVPGLYKYLNEEGTPTVGWIVDETKTLPAEYVPLFIAYINGISPYGLLTDEVIVTPGNIDKLPLHATYMGDTIVGDFTIIKLKHNAIDRGDDMLGYYGEFPGNTVVSSEVLRSMFGFAATNYDVRGSTDVPWLKFSYFGKVLYVAKKPIARYLSWNMLDLAKVIDGQQMIDLNGDRYRVRLLQGGQNATERSEWNDLMYRVSADDPTGTFWERFTDEDLGIGWDPTVNKWYRDGSFSLCQDTYTTSPSNAVNRAGGINATDKGAIALWGAIAKTGESQYYGWRPVLEYVGAEPMEDIRVTSVGEPLPLDWKAEINTVFDGVHLPYDFKTTIVPDSHVVITDQVNTTTLRHITLDKGKMIVPGTVVVTDVVSTSVQGINRVKLKEVSPLALEFTNFNTPLIDIPAMDIGKPLPRLKRLPGKDIGRVLTVLVTDHAFPKTSYGKLGDDAATPAAFSDQPSGYDDTPAVQTAPSLGGLGKLR